MKKKYIVTTREVHKVLYEVVAENPQDAKQKVFDDEGTPVENRDGCSFEHQMAWEYWDVVPYAPITLHGRN